MMTVLTFRSTNRGPQEMQIKCTNSGKREENGSRLGTPRLRTTQCKWTISVSLLSNKIQNATTFRIKYVSIIMCIVYLRRRDPHKEKVAECN